MKKKKDDWDDGRVIAPMNGDELPAYRRGAYSGREGKKTAKGKYADLTKKEKRAMTRALFAVMLPRLLAITLGFAIVALLMVLWLM